MAERRHRASDTWITPAVVIWFIVVAGGLVALLIATTGYLTVRGYDPKPMLDLAAKLVTAVGSLGTLLLQLVTRKTTAKVERNTGLLASEVRDVADALYTDQPPAGPPSIAADPRTGVVGHGPLPPVPKNPPARC